MKLRLIIIEARLTCTVKKNFVGENLIHKLFFLLLYVKKLYLHVSYY